MMREGYVLAIEPGQLYERLDADGKVTSTHVIERVVDDIVRFTKPTRIGSTGASLHLFVGQNPIYRLVSQVSEAQRDFD